MLLTAQDLQPFCSTDHLHEHLLHPWSCDEFTYATDGHVIVRVSRLADIPDNPEAPNTRMTDRVLGPVVLEQPVSALPTVEIPKAKTKECPQCEGGTKALHDCPDCECDCDNCDGKGEVTEDISLDIRGAIYDAKFLRFVLALPNLLFAKAPPPAGPAHFTFGEGGEGAIMPRRVKHTHHIKVKEEPKEIMADVNTLRYDAAVHLMEARKIVDQLRVQAEDLADQERWERRRDEIEELEMQIEPEEAAKATWNRYLDRITGARS